MAYSRDDRFLISVGDYRECSVVIWGTKDYNVLTSSYTQAPIHDLSWDPYTMNEFVSVGEDGNVLFWLLDETRGSFNLNVSGGLWDVGVVIGHLFCTGCSALITLQNSEGFRLEMRFEKKAVSSRLSTLVPLLLLFHYSMRVDKTLI